jgi:hypothetical protein
VVVVLIALACAPAYAASILIEAETFSAYNDLGGIMIYKPTCSGASGGMAADGIDVPGEWIEVQLSVAETGAYADSLRSAGNLNQESDLQITIFAGGIGGTDITSAYHTIGSGIG